MSSEEQRKVVAYYRVSTKKQKHNGLSLDIQKSDVARYVEETSSLLVGEFEEAESGKKRKRRELLKAIEQVKEEGAILVVAKLDRLARDAEFTLNLMNSGVKFIALDMPLANELTIKIFALMAEEEHKTISARVQGAWDKKKELGIKTKAPKALNKEARKKGGKESAITRREEARKTHKKAYALVKEMRSNKKGLRVIADTLNNAGFKTTRGKSFFPQSVKQLINLYEG